MKLDLKDFEDLLRVAKNWRAIAGLEFVIIICLLTYNLT
jgi:hypothetical protein